MRRPRKFTLLIAGLALFSFLVTGLPYGKFSWGALQSAFGGGGCYYSCATPTSEPDASPANVNTINVPQVGMIQIDDLQAQPAYASPNGEIARSNGAEIWLPQDADDSFSDSYVVTGVTRVKGRRWVQISLGSSNFVWVPLDKVTPLTSLPKK
jgi:hypothetical protein